MLNTTLEQWLSQCGPRSAESLRGLAREVAKLFLSSCKSRVGRDRAVESVYTRYGLDSSGFESRWGEEFPHQSRPALEPTQLPLQRVFPGNEVAGTWHLPSTPNYCRG